MICQFLESEIILIELRVINLGLKVPFLLRKGSQSIFLSNNDLSSPSIFVNSNREGENSSSMEGVNDIFDHINIWKIYFKSFKE